MLAAQDRLPDLWAAGNGKALFTFPMFSPKKMWGYEVIWCSPNTLKSLKYSFPKILYHDVEFLI
jgi:hypothetical protein